MWASTCANSAISFRRVSPSKSRQMSRAAVIGVLISQLLQNAARYRGTAPVITLSAKPLGKQTQLIVHDNGIGIPAHELPRVFDRGFTGSNGRNRGSHNIFRYFVLVTWQFASFACGSMVHQKRRPLYRSHIDFSYNFVRFSFAGKVRVTVVPLTA